MIELLCPKCGAVLNQYVITTYPPINMTSCPSCGWKHETREQIIQAVYSKPKPQTNADRIRSMSPLELAVWIAENCGCGDWCMHERSGACANSPKYDGHCCIDVWEDWLNAPAEGGEG